MTLTPRRQLRGTPFTVDHFRRWSQLLVLDSGKRLRLEQHQLEFAEDLFSGVPELWKIVPEGNGKTTEMATHALYHCEFKPTAMVPVAASSREQAEWAYRQAEGLVLRSPYLRDAGFVCQEGYRRIKFPELLSRIQIFAADDRTGDGIIPTLCLLDELHRHRDLRLYRTWRGKLEKRGAQLVAISTAGEPGDEFEEQREAIRQTAKETTRRGRTFVRAAGPELIMHEWAVPEDGDVEDLSLVAEANPLRSITVARLRKKRATPTWTLAHWRRFVCNLPTRSALAAITEAEWASWAAGSAEERIPEGQQVWLGIDLAFKWDTTALVPFWWKSDTCRIFGDPVILEPPRNGDSLDPDLIEAAVLEIEARNPIHTVVVDRSKAEQFAKWCSDTLKARVVERAQSTSYAVVDFQKFMEAGRAGWLRHQNHPVMNRHVLNAIAKPLPGGDHRFERPDTSRGAPAEQHKRVIDALTAASMVHSEAVLLGEGGSGFEAFTQEELEAAMEAA